VSRTKREFLPMASVMQIYLFVYGMVNGFGLVIRDGTVIMGGMYE
jgi:hypothetical protein